MHQGNLVDLTHLRHILAVARTKSFSRAAEQEWITQPAMSRSIAAFERQHSVTLFDRGRSGVHPTAAGSLVIEQAHKLIAASRDLENSLRLYGDGAAGRVALGVGPLMASLLLPELGRAMLQSHPGLRIVTVTRMQEQLPPELFSDRVEMIIGNGLLIGRTPGTDKEDIGVLKLGVTVRAGHPLTRAKAVTRADLADYPFADAVEFTPRGFNSSGGAFVCDNFHILRETVQNTDCVWLSSPTFLARELGEGDLVQLNVLDMPTVEVRVCIASRQGRTRSPAAIAVNEQVKAIFERMTKETPAPSP
jgi:DNA-binding transcriptional LysR family regulator